MLQFKNSFISKHLGLLAYLQIIVFQLSAQPYIPIDLGTFENASLNNALENIVQITSTTQGPSVRVFSNFQGSQIYNHYTINPTDNSRITFVPTFVRYNTPTSFEQNETEAVPTTSAGLAYAGKDGDQTKFINLNTGSFSTLPYNPSQTLALCAPYAINGKILISITLPNSNRRAILSTDGTEAGSVILPFTSSPAGTIFHYRSKGNGTIYISAEVINSSVWVTDGTAAGTKLLLNGKSPNPDMQNLSLGISGDDVCYQSSSRKIFRINGDSTNRTEISTPFAPLQFPTSIFTKFDFSPVGRTGTLLITYNHSALLAGTFEQGLGLISQGSTSFTRIKTVAANASLKTPKFAVPLTSGGALMVYDKSIVKTNFLLGNTDTLKLTDLGYNIQETNVKYHAFDGRLLLTHSQNFSQFGKITITDGTLAGTQLMNSGGTTSACTVDEAGIAWYSIDRNLFRINGTPFTGVKESRTQPSLSVFPNPAQTIVSIHGVKTAEQITAYNTSGVAVPLPQNGNGQFSVTQLKPGLYFLKSNTGAVGKMIVE